MSTTERHASERLRRSVTNAKYFNRITDANASYAAPLPLLRIFFSPSFFLYLSFSPSLSSSLVLIRLIGPIFQGGFHNFSKTFFGPRFGCRPVHGRNRLKKPSANRKRALLVAGGKRGEERERFYHTRRLPPKERAVVASAPQVSGVQLRCSVLSITSLRRNIF